MKIRLKISNIKATSQAEFMKKSNNIEAEFEEKSCPTKILKVSLQTFTGFTLRKICPYAELFWSIFSRIRTRITPNTVAFYAVSFSYSIPRC